MELGSAVTTKVSVRTLYKLITHFLIISFGWYALSTVKSPATFLLWLGKLEKEMLLRGWGEHLTWEIVPIVRLTISIFPSIGRDWNEIMLSIRKKRIIFHERTEIPSFWGTIVTASCKYAFLGHLEPLLRVIYFYGIRVYCFPEWIVFI